MVPITFEIMKRLLSAMVKANLDFYTLNQFGESREFELLLPFGCKLTKLQYRGRSKYAIKFYSHNCNDYIELRNKFSFIPELPSNCLTTNYNNCRIF